MSSVYRAAPLLAGLGVSGWLGGLLVGWSEPATSVVAGASALLALFVLSAAAGFAMSIS
jgi:hypothetical protein